MALDVSTCKNEREKLEWAFRLYDVDASGSINLREITAIMETLNQVEGGGLKAEGSEGEEKISVARKAEIIFQKLDSDEDGELTMQEFVDGYLKIHEAIDGRPRLNILTAPLSPT